MDRGQSSRASNHRRVDQNGDRLTPLTPPEVDVLREIVIGRHTGHIGRRLKIKPKTVDAATGSCNALRNQPKAFFASQKAKGRNFRKNRALYAQTSLIPIWDARNPDRTEVYELSAKPEGVSRPTPADTDSASSVGGTSAFSSFRTERS